MSEHGPDTLIAAKPLSALAGQLEACLVHIYPIGPSMGRRHALGAGRCVVGRSESCDIPVGENAVSRRHAELEWTGSFHAIRDLGSTNGTFVNDALVTAPRSLADGDTIRVGNCIYRFLAGGNVEAEYHEEIYRLTIMDGLTHLHNRRYFTEFLERELARSARHRRPLALLLVDLDHFKAVNDRHGHLCGDAVLREVASRLRPVVRREDLLARFGGEEFAVILVETDAPAARDAAERVRLAVAAGAVRFGGHDVPVTVSVGVAAAGGGEADLSADRLLHRADQQMYRAKHAGRNRVAAE